MDSVDRRLRGTSHQLWMVHHASILRRMGLQRGRSWLMGTHISWLHYLGCGNVAASNSYWNASLKAIKGELSKGRRTLVTIQFGHNDMKVGPPESMGKNLTAMVQQVREIGAEPILVTSLTRRSFHGNGTIADTLEPWAAGEVDYLPCLLGY